jgi:hypothetical protein
MSSDLDLEAVVRSIESAFKPLECVVEVFDYEYRLRFRVFDPDNKPLLTMDEALVTSLRDPGQLNTVVTECRSRVERKGYKLHPWEIPAK